MSKFASDADEFVWDISMNGCAEEFGSVDEGGWYGKIGFSLKDESCLRPMGVTAGYAIIREDDQGFVYVSYYDAREEIEEAWAEIEKAYRFDD